MEMEKKTDSGGHQGLCVQRLVRTKPLVDVGSFHVRDKKPLVPFLPLVTSTMSKHIFMKN